MKRSILIKIVKMSLIPTQRDAKEYFVDIKTLDSKYRDLPERPNKVKQHTLKIGITGTLDTMWRARGLNNEGVEKTLLELGKRYIIEKIKDDTLSAKEELQLGTSNAPNNPPFDPDLIRTKPGYEEEIMLEEMESQQKLVVGVQIVDLLDNINAIFYDEHKQLLFRPREYRATLELIRMSTTKEEFTYRIAALCNIIDGINKDVLQSILNEDDGQIILLSKYLTSIGLNGKAITTTLQNILKVRKAFPVHSDAIDGVVQAHKYFGLSYPIANYEAAWDKLLLEFKNSLNSILEGIQK